MILHGICLQFNGCITRRLRFFVSLNVDYSLHLIRSRNLFFHVFFYISIIDAKTTETAAISNKSNYRFCVVGLRCAPLLPVCVLDRHGVCIIKDLIQPNVEIKTNCNKNANQASELVEWEFIWNHKIKCWHSVALVAAAQWICVGSATVAWVSTSRLKFMATEFPLQTSMVVAVVVMATAARRSGITNH